jgi:hypothetical protein
MFPRAETVLKQVNLETVTPEEALAVVQQLPADILRQAGFTYYVDLFEAVGKIAGAALQNQEVQNGRRGLPV